MTDILLDLADPVQKYKLLDYCRALKPVKYRVTIKRDYPKRTNQQNRYYWGVVCEIFAGWARDVGNDGFTKDDAHRFLAEKFLSVDTVGKGGEIIGHTIRSTASLTTAEFIDYIEQCAKCIAELCEIEVPLPNYTE